MLFTQEQRTENLIIVAAIDGYASAHCMSNEEAFEIFRQCDMFRILRDNYDTLHTQDLFEGAEFASDYIARLAT
jgi:hypothetical protein